MKEIFAFFWLSIRKYKWYYILMAMAPIIGAFYKPLSYYAIKLILDAISSVHEFRFNQLIVPITLFIIAELGLSFVWRAAQVLEWKSEPYVRQGILVNALQKLLTFRFNFFQNTAAGSITSKIKGLVDGYDNLWRGLYFGISLWVCVSIISTFSIFFINIKLGFFTLIWGLIFLVVNYYFAKRINQLSNVESEAKHEALGELADSISNANSVKLLASSTYEVNRLNANLNSKYVPREVARNK